MNMTTIRSTSRQGKRSTRAKPATEPGACGRVPISRIHNMFFANVTQKWNIRLTMIDPWEGSRDWIIGQLWEYDTRPPEPDKKSKPEPNFFMFTPRYVPDFEGIAFASEGRPDKTECLESVKCNYVKLKRCGIIKERAKLAFSMSPVEQVF